MRHISVLGVAVLSEVQVENTTPARLERSHFFKWLKLLASAFADTNIQITPKGERFARGYTSPFCVLVGGSDHIMLSEGKKL